MMQSKGASRLAVLLCLIYAAVVGGVVWSMFRARQSALADLTTPQSIGDWQAWLDDVRQQKETAGAVARRIPKSDEPPGLVLMRDNFVACLVGAIVFASLLYWVLAWLIAGMLRTPSRTIVNSEDACDGRLQGR